MEMAYVVIAVTHGKKNSTAITLAEYKCKLCFSLLTSLHGDAQIEYNLPFFPILEVDKLPGDHHL
jgi:hypothetical protein